ncbi:MAG: hypothetical protein EPN25_05145 [Nitrospirae bacterium]|nr:MAG: hypothetical protein EPN25_05145 [Nitrospirota bacterium]
MKLGILINTDRHLQHVVGITEAALARGHEVQIFTMDAGTRLLNSPEYSALCRMQGVTMNFCSLNAKQGGMPLEALSEEINSGSQYDNAVMNHSADRVIVL